MSPALSIDPQALRIFRRVARRHMWQRFLRTCMGFLILVLAVGGPLLLVEALMNLFGVPQFIPRLIGYALGLVCSVISARLLMRPAKPLPFFVVPQPNCPVCDGPTREREEVKRHASYSFLECPACSLDAPIGYTERP
jgi:hypothetical protein